jgi:hypothetical protein
MLRWVSCSVGRSLKRGYMGCEILMMVTIEMADICDVAPFSLVEHYHCLRGNYYLSLLLWRWRQQFPLKCVNILHTIISQKKIVWIINSIVWNISCNILGHWINKCWSVRIGDVNQTSRSSHMYGSMVEHHKLKEDTCPKQISVLLQICPFASLKQHIHCALVLWNFIQLHNRCKHCALLREQTSEQESSITHQWSAHFMSVSQFIPEVQLFNCTSWFRRLY